MTTPARVIPFCAALLVVGTALGQSTPDSLRQGVLAYESGDYDRSIRLLAHAVRNDPTAVDNDMRPGSYWLGLAYKRVGNRQAMLDAWALGVTSLLDRGAFDPILGDALMWEFVNDGQADRSSDASELYLRILYSLSEPLSERQRAVANLHMNQALLVLPAGLEREVTASRERNAVLQAETVREIISWWRSEDPLPASPPNERIIEHLRRIAESLQKYSAKTPTGLDDRGELFVRLGRPYRIQPVKYDDPKLTSLIFRPGVTVTLSEFPLAEVWSYGQYEREAYYVFVQKSGWYQISTLEDLLPRTLQSGFNPSSRGTQKSVMAIAVLRSVYQQLAGLHPDLALRYDDLDTYAMLLEDAGMMESGILGGLAERGADTADPRIQNQRPHVFAQSTLQKYKAEDDQATWRRERLVVKQRSTVLENVDEIAVAVRTARFLADDGSTTTEIYWAPLPGTLRRTANADDAYVLKLTAAQKTSNFEDRIINQRRYFINSLNADNSTIPVQTMAVQGDVGLYHIALQWDQHPISSYAGEQIRLGERIGVASRMLDSLQALPRGGRGLSMSDLKPMYGTQGAEWFNADGTPSAAVSPYPFESITTSEPFAAYFEIYNLNFGADDQTHYTVEYAVEEPAGRGGFLRFTGADRQRTSVTTRNVGTERNQREYILLDFSDWTGEGRLVVTVTVTDETTGESVVRTLSFQLAS